MYDVDLCLLITTPVFSAFFAAICQIAFACAVDLCLLVTVRQEQATIGHPTKNYFKKKF